MEFETKTLNGISTIKNGKKIDERLDTGKYPIYGSNGIIGYSNETNADAKTIIIGRVGANCGSVHFSDKKMWISDNAISVAPNDDTDPYFLFYLLSTKRLNELASGSAQPLINQSILNSISLLVPEYEQQRHIGSILKSFDMKVNVNNNKIDILEQLAQTLFKRWFVDFEFPNENGDPYKSSGGEMVESELGMVPAAFEVQFLSQSVDFLSGGTPKTKIGEYWNGEIPFFTPKDATGTIYATQTEKNITELGLSKCNSKLYPKNTIFITARGTVGKLSMANKEMAMNQSCFALKHKEDSQYFLYFMTKTLLRQIIQGSNGAVFNAINLRDLNTLKVVYPKKKLVLQFERMIEPIFEMISEKEYENINLVTLRNVLLPKLLSGEIDLGSESEVTI